MAIKSSSKGILFRVLKKQKKHITRKKFVQIYLHNKKKPFSVYNCKNVAIKQTN